MAAYAVIPHEVLANRTLSNGAKLLYANLSRDERGGKCLDDNKLLSKKMSVSVRSIQKWIKELEDQGYISRSIYIHESKTVIEINLTGREF